MNYEIESIYELPTKYFEKIKPSLGLTLLKDKEFIAIIPMQKDNKLSVSFHKGKFTNEKDCITWIEYLYKTEQEDLEFAQEIGELGYTKYYSSEYKRGYKLSRTVYIS